MFFHDVTLCQRLDVTQRGEEGVVNGKVIAASGQNVCRNNNDNANTATSSACKLQGLLFYCVRQLLIRRERTHLLKVVTRTCWRGTRPQMKHQIGASHKVLQSDKTQLLF